MGKQGAKASAGSPAKGNTGEGGSRFCDRRDLESQALRAIEEHFPNMSPMFITSTPKEGKTLLSKVMEARSAIKGTRKKLGSSFWQECRVIYQDGLNEDTSALQVKDSSQPLNEMLVKSMESARAVNTTKRSQQGLITYFQNCDSLNHREFVACCRHILGVRPAANPVSQDLVLEFMRCVVRCSLQEQFAAELQVVVPVFDSCLLQTLAAFRKTLSDPAAWWKSFRREGALVLDSEAMERILAAGNKNFGAVAKDISSIVSLSRTGEKLFGWAAPQVLSEQAEIELKKRLEPLQGKALKEADLEEVRKKCLAWCREANAEQVLSVKRNISVTYRGLRVEVPVQNFADEMHMRISAFVKSEMVGSGALKELSFEQGLLGSKSEFVACEPSIVECFVNVRGVVESLIKDVPQEGNIILDYIRRKHVMFKSLDRSWWVEFAAFEALNSEAGLAKIQQMVLEALPKQVMLKRLGHSLQLIDQVKGSSTYRFGNASVKACADSIRAVLTSMIAGESPAISFLNGTQWGAQVLGSLALFCQFTTKSKQGAPSQVLSGAAALRQKLLDAQAKATKKSLSFSDLTELHTFSWLLSQDEGAQLKTLSNELVSAVKSGSKRRVSQAASSTTAPESEKDAAKKKAKENEKAAIMSIFG